MIQFIISMYDEHRNVLHSIKEIKSKFTNSNIIVVHSFDKVSQELDDIKTLTDYIPLENLGNKINRFKLASNAICRNLSAGFSKFYDTVTDNCEYMVILLGDVKVIDASNFNRVYKLMIDNNWYLYIQQSIGAYFFAPDHYKEKDLNRGTRYQHEKITDFMPQFFIIDGTFARKHRCFETIEIVNEYCSEHCLGNEVLRCFNNDIDLFHKYTGKFYDYRDGISYHEKN